VVLGRRRVGASALRLGMRSALPSRVGGGYRMPPPAPFQSVFTRFVRGCKRRGKRGGGWHKASVSDCLPLAAPIGLSPLLILTLGGPERVLVVSTEPPDDLSCLTTPGVGRPGDGAVARAGDQVHPDAPSESMWGLPTPALTCAHWDVHLQDNFPAGASNKHHDPFCPFLLLLLRSGGGGDYRRGP
jgi:hypothetical protein